MPSTEQEEYLYSYKTYPALRGIPPHCKHQAIREAVTSPQFAAKSKEQNEIYGGEYKGQLGEVEYTILEQTEPPAEGPRPKRENPVLDSPEQEKPCDEDRLNEIAELPVELPGFFPGRLWRVRGFTPRLKARTDTFTQAYGTD